MIFRVEERGNRQTQRHPRINGLGVGEGWLFGGLGGGGGGGGRGEKVVLIAYELHPGR